MSILKSSPSHAIGKKKMVNKEQCFNDVLTWPNICFVEPLQSPTTRRQGDVKDVNDDNISKKMNKQVPFENFSPVKARLNYD